MDVDYYRVFNLNREPFSSSPDPDFLYQSRQHFGILQFLENSIRTRTGVNLVIGAPGTGKTTLCRHLCIKMSKENNIDAYLLNSRFCDTVRQFEEDVLRALDMTDSIQSTSMKAEDQIFKHFCEKMTYQTKTVALVIDDGHMIPECCFGFLDKIASLQLDGQTLIQLVIFANREFRENLKGNSGLENKIAKHRILGPLNFTDTRDMIEYRLKIASNSIKKNKLFTYPAMFAIYLATGGYPKKIVKLCHSCILSMKMRHSMKGGWFLVRSNARRVLSERRFFPESAITAMVFIVPLIAVAFILNTVRVNYIHNDVKKEIVSVSDNQKTTGSDLEQTVNLPVGEEDTSKKDQVDVSDKINEIETPQVKDKPLPVATLPKEPVEVKEPPPVVLHSMPEIIGVVEIKRGDTLLVMLEKVYGHSQKKYRIPLFKANEHIANINNLEIGDRIKFPLLIADVKPPADEKYWVMVSHWETLNESYDYLRSWPGNAPKIKLISSFSPDKGLEFRIVLRKRFKTQDSSKNALGALPPDLVQDGEVFQFKFDKTIYFADPFFKY